MKKTISILVRAIISAAILLFLFKQVDLGRIIQIISGVNKPILIAVLLLVLACYAIGFLRWRMLIAGLGLNLSSSLIFKPYCLGFFSNLFFPSTIGGDFLRSIDLGLRTQKPRRVIASVILDRLSGYSALGFVALPALSFGHRLITDPAVFFALGAILALLVVILAILFNNFLFSKSTKILHLFGKWGEALSSLHYEIYNFRNQKRIIVKNFICSLIMQLSSPISFYLISLALGVRINPIYFFILVPIIATISALPVSVAGLGLREASSMYFFTRVGMPGEVALTIALLGFFLVVLIGITGGILYALTFSHRRLQCD